MVKGEVGVRQGGREMRKGGREEGERGGGRERGGRKRGGKEREEGGRERRRELVLVPDPHTLRRVW